VDPAHNEYSPAAEGHRLVQIDVKWRSTRGDPLPIDWARFTLVDADGRRWAERYRLPARQLEHGRPNPARLVTVGFELPAGARPARVSMSSAVAALRMRGGWAVPPE
jgi:hypothetical protein